MKLNSQRRRSPPAVVWLFVVVLIVALAAVGLMAQLTRYRARQVEALQAEVAALQDERETTQAQLASLQGTATVMEDRLASLEASDPARQLAALQAAVDNAGDSQELASVQASLDGLQARVDTFQAALDELAARLEALEPAENGEPAAGLPPQVRLDVARQRQTHNLSCESSAASMVAQYHGLALTEADVLGALPLNDDPNLGFRGNVDGPTGGIEDYGVYAGPILDVLNAHGLRATRIETGLAGIKAAVARGNPVITWVTYNCLVSTPTTATIAGRDVVLVPNQHVVVVTGYNAEGVWANDPWDGQEDFYTYSDFQRAMGYFGDATSPVMAIEVAAP